MNSSPVESSESVVRTPSNTDARSRSNSRQEISLMGTMDIAAQKWRNCHTWEAAQVLHKDYWSGELDFHVGSSCEEEDRENGYMRLLQDDVYMIERSPRRLVKGHSSQSRITITRQQDTAAL